MMNVELKLKLLKEIKSLEQNYKRNQDGIDALLKYQSDISASIQIKLNKL